MLAPLLALVVVMAPLSLEAGSAIKEGKSFLEEPLPGAPGRDPDLVRALRDRWERRPSSYEPRTRHRDADGRPVYTNRLFLSSSPYLLQHAHNPVDWYPWGDEAFEQARKLGRPVLLSIGYSTCHWCHVMEEESFEDEEIAALINSRYIAIKVDREERPDVDAIYMTAVQALTGGGGWPLNVWLTPEREPFYGGTYFPARDGDRGTRTGFLTLLGRIRRAYDERPAEVAQSAAALTARIRDSMTPGAGREGPPEAKVLDAAVRSYAARFDDTHGGTQGAPKFPSHLPIRLLLRDHRRTGSQRSLTMATLTLEKMAAGGMYDHVAGGFHRYSTDSRWLVPHFEKMLYDNALLAVAYLEAYQVTGNAEFVRVAREILRYVERDMTSPEGAFYSATDADSLTPSGRREEGWSFTWTPAEIDAALDADQARLVAAYYAVTSGGNFEGRNILHAPRSLDQVAAGLGMTSERARTVLEAARERLYQVRARRPAPLRDEKILAAWNGLMISAYARGALVLDERRHAEIAARAADFVLARMRAGGRLRRSHVDGRAEHNAYLDDYAFVIAGLLDLHEATSDPRWLREAISLDRSLELHYEDRKGGGYFRTSDDHETLLAREKPGYDGAEPSGNSVQALNLLRLHELTTTDSYRRRAERTFGAFAGALERGPMALSEMLLALDFHADTPKEILIVVPRRRSEAEPFLAELRRTYLPNRVLAVAGGGEDLTEQAKLIPLLRGKVARGGNATAYVCENRVCALPTGDPEVFARQLRQKSKPARPEPSPSPRSPSE